MSERPAQSCGRSRVERVLRARLTRWAAWAVVLTLLGSFLPRMYLRSRLPTGNDVMVYLAAARALMHGGNPYSKGDVPQGHGPYPLTVDTLFIPLTWVPLWLAEAIWFGLNVLALVGALLILERLWRRTGATSAALAVPFVVRLAAIMLVMLVPLQSHFSFGQLDLLVLLVCCLFLAGEVGGRDGEASLWLGAGIALKLTPSVFVVDLAARRRIRLLALAVAWAIAWAVLAPALVSDRVVPLYRDGWLVGLRHHLDSPVTVHWRTRFALAGVLVRIWPSIAAVPGLHYWVAAVVLAPLVGLQGAAARDPRKRLMLFGLYLAAIPLVSPISEMHHLTMLLGPLWLWLLAAGSAPSLHVLDAVGASVFVAFHWLGIAWNQTLALTAVFHAPSSGGPRTGSLFEGGAVLVLYLVLLLRAYITRRWGDSASATNGSGLRGPSRLSESPEASAPALAGSVSSATAPDA